jgi:hypothetical protein
LHHGRKLLFELIAVGNVAAGTRYQFFRSRNARLKSAYTGISGLPGQENYIVISIVCEFVLLFWTARRHQHPLDEIPPKRLPVVNAPAFEGIAGVQGTVEETPGCAAVVFAPCVVVLGASPGNCRAA